MTTMAVAAPVERPSMRDKQRFRAMTIGLLHVVQAGQQWRSNYAKELGLGTSDLVALGHVYDHGPIPPRELGAAMDLTSGSVTALLDRIEKAGFILRSSNPEDRRSLLIAVTPAGRHAMEWIYEQADASLEQGLSSAPGLPIDQFATILENLGQALSSHDRQ